jgi:RNA polymerase sigma-B factor
VSVEDVTEALAADGCFRPESLDRDVGAGKGTPLGALLRDDTDDLASAEARVMLAPAVRRLPQPDRRMVQLRFFRGWTYREIGRELGMTPLQVSRRLGKVLGLLRHELS